ncbi:MAG: hypothetical protein M0Z50_07265 [Planctomycetia bacterium]|nr:hypothetical protein [Planctomycetia bacterium]
MTHPEMPGKPVAGKVARGLILFILLLLALGAIGVVNWKVGRGVPVRHTPIVEPSQ